MAIAEVVVAEMEARARVIRRHQAGQHQLTEVGFRAFVGALESLEGIGLPYSCFDGGTASANELAIQISNFMDVVKGVSAR